MVISVLETSMNLALSVFPIYSGSSLPNISYTLISAFHSSGIDIFAYSVVSSSGS